ncbi:aminodeoxychorismate synthase component I [Streptomyces armeniacus]|uniref:Aminodeoxychorismate synthase n=1 Tax=Streptomyces armeniacus TaxID=83291 RepID=A0A345XQ13_9ACTN|nr:aminodeoxychorismate synthase component I [Streptomyces armeniacus]AXK33729.1 aminodeoxychorismate synthase component I [Streptomyces armeniacus]QIQ28653.1 Nbc57 [Streptomyces sp.]
MRTLLVDNYDSFTYNLFHYLAEVNGREPVVIRNDDPSWHPRMLKEFDSILISPGPGSPDRPEDFGICREIIDGGELPVLGVCLGHQGIAHSFGARVGRAPEPRHGRLSEVFHDGTELFAGIPTPFPVVRYHSLAVTDLPDELEATATADDGVLMGLRHRERPFWGVQFHPESIATEYGHQLLHNFRDLAQKFGRGSAAQLTAPASASETVTAPSGTRPAGTRELTVLARSLPTRWQDEVVYEQLFKAQDHAFWLDSGAATGENGRFSFMGDATGPLARVAKADVWERHVTVETADGSETVPGEFLTWLQEDLRSLHVELPELPFDFALGWVGYLGYELKAECGGDRGYRSDEPDAAMIFADRAVAFDHATSTTYLLALAEDGAEESARTWLDDTGRRLTELAGREPRYTAPDNVPTPLRLRHDRDSYLSLIDRCQEEIAAGTTYEVCLTNMVEAATEVEPWQSYQFLRRLSPAPFASLLRFGCLSVLSTSPERFLRISADGMAESKPIKGTRPRGASDAEDELLRRDLETSPKDRSENLMIVDLVRNDLGRTAEVGSVSVPKLFEVETHPTTYQLVSTVSARLRESSSAVECVRAAFPGGSMTGAPKIRTMQIIEELEAGPRGVYSGAIGYFSLSGACDLSIVIRTLVVTPSRVRYGVGGAIVALSDTDDEYEETAVKATPLLRLLSADFPGRVPVSSGAAR